MREALLEAPVHAGKLSVARTRGEAPRAAVLLIHGFAQNRFAWQLPGRSFPKYLAAQGYDVFNLELRGHGRSRDLGTSLPRRFEEYVEHDVPAALELIAQLGHRRVFIVGHSLGGAIAYASAAAAPERVRGVVTFSGVFRWGNAGPWMSRMIRVVRGGSRMGRFVGWRPEVRLDVLSRNFLTHYRKTRDDRLPVPIQGWYPGSIEPDILEQWLTLSLDRTSGSVLSLMARWATSGRFCDSRERHDYAARWHRSGLPVLVVAADRDRLAHPIKDVKPAFDASTSGDRTFRCFGRTQDGRAFGHVDLVMGRHAPELVWPFVADWLNQRRG